MGADPLTFKASPVLRESNRTSLLLDPSTLVLTVVDDHSSQDSNPGCARNEIVFQWVGRGLIETPVFRCQQRIQMSFAPESIKHKRKGKG
jgi:hypothetical protein